MATYSSVFRVPVLDRSGPARIFIHMVHMSNSLAAAVLITAKALPNGSGPGR
jgi:hypothetical protein